MTAYIITPEQYQLYKVAMGNQQNPSMELAFAYEDLVAMKPVGHIAELMWDEEKQKSYMQYTMPIGLLPEGSKLYVKDQQ